MISLNKELIEDLLNLLPCSRVERKERLSAFLYWFNSSIEEKKPILFILKNKEGDGEMAAVVEELHFLFLRHIQPLWVKEKKAEDLWLEVRKDSGGTLILWLGEQNISPKVKPFVIESLGDMP